MSKKKRAVFIVVWVALMVIVLVAALLVGGSGESESIKVVMRDAVLHGTNKVSLFGIKDVNPAYISSLIVCGALLVFAAVIRIFVIPKFKMVPGKFQMLLEQLVTFFDNLAKTSSPHKNSFLGAYVFAAGVYIFVGTLFELFGNAVLHKHLVQAATTAGGAISLPAPLSDINAAIMLGCLSYLVILSGGIAGAKIKGVGRTLKEFSLPISMSFRLFGALLSGLLVTELVYYNISLSFVLPVFVGIMFTLLHALIQAYVLTMLTAMFYGEVSEPPVKAVKKRLSKSTNK